MPKKSITKPADTAATTETKIEATVETNGDEKTDLPVVKSAADLEIEHLGEILASIGLLKDGDGIIERAKIIIVNSSAVSAELAKTLIQVEAAREHLQIVLVEKQELADKVGVLEIQAGRLQNELKVVSDIREQLETENKDLRQLHEALSHAEVPEGRLLAEGTKLNLGETEVTLASAAIVNYPLDQSEQKFVGILQNSAEGNFDANKRSLKFLYSRTTGALLPLEDQPEELRENLSDDERRRFGLPVDPVETEETEVE